MPRMSTLSGTLAAIAAEHQGLVTRRLARAQHVSPSVLAAALRSGGLRRLRPGVFADQAVWHATEVHDRYALLVRGVLLGHGRWLASHHAALALLGLPLCNVDSTLVDVVAAVRTSKRRPGLHVHVATKAQRLLVADPTSSCVTAADACVLTAAEHGFEPGVVAMDAAVKRGMASVADLKEALNAAGIRYGAPQAAAAIAAIDPACESPGETRTRLILTAAGLSVRSQVALGDSAGFIGRVDFLVGERVVVEFDGAMKYEGIDGKRALVEEKRREERLRDAGFRIVRVTWAELARPAQLVARVRSHLAAA